MRKLFIIEEFRKVSIHFKQNYWYTLPQIHKKKYSRFTLIG